MSDEKLCLKWDDFYKNITNTFNDLRRDTDFSDVTLVCADGQLIDAHRIVIAASSPIFSSLLKKNDHFHPMIYMRGLKAKDLMAIVDFIYHGEVEIEQDDLTQFLDLGKELQLKGITGSRGFWDEVKTDKISKKFKNVIRKPNIKCIVNEEDKSMVSLTADGNETCFLNETGVTVFKESDEVGDVVKSKIEDNPTEEKFSSMIEMVTKRIWKCTLCGKITNGSRTQAARHTEAHLEGVAHPCPKCENISRTSNGLQVHMSRNH